MDHSELCGIQSNLEHKETPILLATVRNRGFGGRGASLCPTMISTGVRRKCRCPPSFVASDASDASQAVPKKSKDCWIWKTTLATTPLGIGKNTLDDKSYISQLPPPPPPRIIPAMYSRRWRFLHVCVFRFYM
jgi:hypothetical protein